MYRIVIDINFTIIALTGHALADLNLDDIDLNSIDKDIDETNSLSSSLSGLTSSGK